jgi:hypothetical protein
LPEFTMDKLLKDDLDAWNNIKDTFIQSFSLPTEVSATGPMSDVLKNKSWANIPIESAADKRKPAYLRRDDKTSLLANMIGNLVQNEKGLSPKQIDYLIKGYLGGVGDFFWRLPDTIKSGTEVPTDITQYPVIKSFMVDSAYSSDVVNKLYGFGEELGTRYEGLKDTGEYTAMSHLPVEQQKKLFVSLEAARKEFNSISRDFSDARKAIKELKNDEKLSPTAKKMKERQIHVKMNKIASDFNEKYQKFKEKYDIR